jgi:hypothetical protein
LFGSAWSGVQVPEQLISPLGHWHVPPWQVSPPVHVNPPAQPAVLAPQYVSFVCGLMHMAAGGVPQKASPVGQTHVPLWQLCPPLHVTPHDAVLVLQ